MCPLVTMKLKVTRRQRLRRTNDGSGVRARLKGSMRDSGRKMGYAGSPWAAAGCAAQRRAGAVGAPRLSLLNLGVIDTKA